MKAIKLFMIMLCITSIACSPKFYTPNTQNTPMLQNKGQASATLAGNGNQVELQGAYAATDHIGIQVNGAAYIPKDQDNGNGGSGKLIEVGAGYFTPLSDKVSFETYGLIGFGSFENYLPSTFDANPETSANIEGKIMRYGIQPGINYQTNSFGIGLSSRITQLSYSDIKGDLIFGNVDQVSFLQDRKSSLMVEPALTIRGGTERIKLQLQLVTSINISHEDFRQDDGTLTLGLNYKIN